MNLTQTGNLPSIIGCPMANVPLWRYHLNGVTSRPFRLAVLAKQAEEGTIFKVMIAYKAKYPPRVISNQLPFYLYLEFLLPGSSVGALGSYATNNDPATLARFFARTVFH